MEAIRLEMAPLESRPCRWDFRRREELTDDALASVALSISPATGLTAGSATIVGTEIRVRLTAGSSTGSFRITVTGTTTTNSYIEVGHVDVTIGVPP